MEEVFNVGDRVKIIDNAIFNVDLKVGDVGDIICLTKTNLIIDFHKKGSHIQTCYKGYASRFLKLVDRKPIDQSKLNVIINKIFKLLKEIKTDV